MHYLRREYGLIINHKKVYRLCKELDVLKNQRVLKPKIKRRHHERIPVKTPNKNAHVESFHRILEDECFKSNEFQSYEEAYKIVNDFINFYNNRRLHSSLKYMTPNEFYHLYSGEQLTNIEVRV